MRYRLLHPVELAMPWVPLDLEGLRIAHLTDLHVQRSRRRFQRLMTELQATPVDMAVMTGDYMDQRGHEAATVKVLEVQKAADAFCGRFAHDTACLACSAIMTRRV